MSINNLLKTIILKISVYILRVIYFNKSHKSDIFSLYFNLLIN